jgi:hypothetical protein
MVYKAKEAHGCSDSRIDQTVAVMQASLLHGMPIATQGKIQWQLVVTGWFSTLRKIKEGIECCHAPMHDYFILLTLAGVLKWARFCLRRVFLVVANTTYHRGTAGSGTVLQ